MNLLLNPLWSISWHIAPIQSPRHCNIVKYSVINVPHPYLIRSVYPRGSLKNAVNTVADMEPMGPVMISHCSVVGLHHNKECHLTDNISQSVGHTLELITSFSKLYLSNPKRSTNMKIDFLILSMSLKPVA